MYVYTIRFLGPPWHVKIGASKNPLERLRQLQTGSGLKLEICHAVWMGGEAAARRLEKALHDELKGYRVNGGTEWFNTKALKFVRNNGAIVQSRRDRHPACAEFCDKRIRGTPQEVIAQLESMLR